MFKMLMDRVKEPSTSAGLASLFLALGFTFEAAEVYALGVSAVFGVISMVMSEKGKRR